MGVPGRALAFAAALVGAFCGSDSFRLTGFRAAGFAVFAFAPFAFEATRVRFAREEVFFMRRSLARVCREVTARLRIVAGRPEARETARVVLR